MDGGEIGFRESGEMVERGKTLGTIGFGGSSREMKWMAWNWLAESANWRMGITMVGMRSKDGDEKSVS